MTTLPMAAGHPFRAGYPFLESLSTPFYLMMERELGDH